MVDLATPCSPALRGRADEQAAVRGLLSGARAGSGGALLVSGERGMGKTALLADATGAAGGFAVLTVAGVVDEMRLPYAALHRLLHPVLDQLDAVPSGPRQAFTQALDGSDTGSRRLTVFTAALTLLTSAGRDQPLLCAVDDVDRLDRPSRDAIGFIGRRVAQLPVALLATACHPDAIAGVPSVHLNGLTEAESRAVLDQLLPGGLAAGTAAALVRVAGGNPQALVDLALALTPQQRRGDCSPPHSLPDNSALKQSYRADLRRLPASTRWLLLVAAADPDMNTGCLIHAARGSDMDISALLPAERAGLLRVASDHVAFPQPLVRAIVYEAAALAERRRAHLCVADAAASAGDYRRAAAAMTAAAELTCEPRQTAGRLMAAARYAWQAGDPRQARQLLRGAAGSPEVAAERRLLLGEIDLRTGAAELALTSLVAAATTFAGRHRDLAIRALLRATEAAWFAGDHSQYGILATLARTLRRGEATADQEQILAYVVGLGELFQRRPKPGLRSLRRVVTLAESLENVPALILASAASLLLADYPGAQRLAAEAAEAALFTGYVSAVPLALELRADAEHGLGRYDAAQASCQAGLQAATETGQANYAAAHVAMLAVFAAIRGDHDACQQRLRELSVPAGAGPYSRPAALRQWALAVVDLAAGRPAGAAARLTAIGNPTTGRGQIIVQVMATPWLVEAAAYAGTHREQAGSALKLYRRWANSTNGPIPQALTARCEALLSAQDGAAATDRFSESLRLHRAGECDFEYARTELLFGRELRRQRRPRAAREHLRRAWESFQHLSLESWAEQAGAELRAAGEATEGRIEVLTAQQLQVAQLVAGGATNREVAARLFLSPRTVDHHLRNIFYRLGIRSRVELARLLS